MATESLKIFNKNLAEKLIIENSDSVGIFDSCFLEDEVYLDYYGCYAYLNIANWKNTISSLEIFPDCEDGEIFILLHSNHIDKIVKSLIKHKNKLTIMKQEEINEVIRFKEFCVENEDYMVAYMFDF